MIADITAAEVALLARRMEARARRTRDRDLARAGALLRILLAVLTADTHTAEPPIEAHQAAEEGRLN